MASTNQSPFYKKAEQEFLLAATTEEKIKLLEIMIKECPKHKSSEKMLSNLKQRYKKLKQNLEKSKKSSKGKKQSIKKEQMQAILIGFPNTGKSSLFNLLTNQTSNVSPIPFTTYEPIQGIMYYEDAKIQLIDSPPFPHQDKSLINSADTLLLVIDNLSQINQAQKFIENSTARLIILFNKEDMLNEQEKRKIEATFKSKKLNFAIISAIKSDKNQIEQLKKQIFKTFPIIRIYTKEPHKPATIEPMILKQNATVKDVAEKILKGMSKKVRQIRIWGPSSKFSGQIVGINHQLKDKDIIEFQTT